ncbi:hypothetical protein HDU97_007155 [Phlyctochytrium planicorne]|nr:hypothetical protein HDU97_007155 [Phlyctochytrium planicorne]
MSSATLLDDGGIAGDGKGPVKTQDELRTFFYEETTNMRNYWYPLMLSTEVVHNKVISMHILDDPVVVYRDPETKKAVAFADKCPHRSAPLSVGRIMDGKLECRYHGWQFDAEGQVTKIPSLLEGKRIPANAKVRKYPTFEDKYFVWIWPGDKDVCARTPDPKPFFKAETAANARFGYYDFDIDHCLFSKSPSQAKIYRTQLSLVENFLDPAHLPFTHDTTISNRSQITPLGMSLEFTPQGTIRGKESTPERPDRIQLEFEFKPPCAVSLLIGKNSDQVGILLLSYKIARWNFNAVSIICRYNYKVTFEDYAMLVGQQKRLARGANAMNSPVAADILIKTYRNWWRKAMKKKPYFAGYSEDIEDMVLNGCSASVRGEMGCGSEKKNSKKKIPEDMDFEEVDADGTVILD